MAYQPGPPTMSMFPARYPVHPYASFGVYTGWGQYGYQYPGCYQPYMSVQHGAPPHASSAPFQTYQPGAFRAQGQHAQSQAQLIQASVQQAYNYATGGNSWMGYQAGQAPYNTSWQSGYGYPFPPIQYLQSSQQVQSARVGQPQSMYSQFPRPVPPQYLQCAWQYQAQAHQPWTAPRPPFSFTPNQAQLNVPHLYRPQPGVGSHAPVPNSLQAGFSAEGLAKTGISNTELANSLQEYVSTMPRDQRQKIQQPKGMKVEKHSNTYSRGVKVIIFNTARPAGQKSGKAKIEPAGGIKKEKRIHIKKERE